MCFKPFFLLFFTFYLDNLCLYHCPLLRLMPRKRYRSILIWNMIGFSDLELILIEPKNRNVYYDQMSQCFCFFVKEKKNHILPPRMKKIDVNDRSVLWQYGASLVSIYLRICIYAEALTIIVGRSVLQSR